MDRLAAAHAPANVSIFRRFYPAACLRGAYARKSAISTGLYVPPNPLLSLSFPRRSALRSPLTSAFGGQRSIQLSYGR